MYKRQIIRLALGQRADLHGVIVDEGGLDQLVLHKGVELSLIHIFESRTETVEAIPVDVALGSFRVNVLAVGKVETAVIVLGVIGAVGSGSSVVSC